MNELRDALEEYLAVRRSLGFDLRLPASLLRNFICFLEDNEATYITRALAVRWAVNNPATPSRLPGPDAWEWSAASPAGAA